MNHEYYIDNIPISLDYSELPFTGFGKSEILSNEKTDVTYNQPWYEEGYTLANLFNDQEFNLILNGISNCINKILKTNILNLEKYHTFVNDDTHYQVVNATRNLFPPDFDFPVSDVISKLEDFLGFKLTDVDPDTGKPLRIIVRINRPNSFDLNPPHKDIYESYDRFNLLPKIVNFWIPICGVTNKTMLPIVPKSHFIPEDKILRTFEGGCISKNKYRVRSVLSWNNEKKLIRKLAVPKQSLVFTPHLIHGCAINQELDITRIALEFRLFPKLKS